ncbi:hypothetical protein MPLA_1830084 [Mesorhizobium sp. ORS 3359]|nr:hypothetical protein MPLA_1830084 [Mesorhizobium sp. ORS 3359]
MWRCATRNDVTLRRILENAGLRPSPRLEHDAEKCERFSADIMLYFFDLETNSDFRSNRPEIIRL